MTLAAADRNGLGATPTAALSLTLAFAILRKQLIKIYSDMVTMKFSATKSKTVFLTPTIAVEQDNSETAIRFALWHGVFSVEVSKSYKTVKAK